MLQKFYHYNFSVYIHYFAIISKTGENFKMLDIICVRLLLIKGSTERNFLNMFTVSKSVFQKKKNTHKS